MKTLVIILMTAVFWNVENFFGDRPYFTVKCNGIAKTLMMIADSEGEMPDIIAFAEIGDRKVLSKLIYNTALRKYDYRIVHYDSPDKRGIDCALLYRKSKVNVIGSKPCHLYDTTGAVMDTRDILLVETDSLDILVNHHPSKVGEDSGRKRKAAMDRMTSLCDSLQKEGHQRVLCIGDFNDNLWGSFTQGTIKYNGEWEKIDGHFSRGLEVEEKVFTAPHLLTRDTRFGGMKPLRSFSGPRYLGGVSDHLPIILDFGLQPSKNP